jgi:hypothetical protein
MGEGGETGECVLRTGEMRNYYKILQVKSERTWPRGSNSRRLLNDMKMDLKEITSGTVDCVGSLEKGCTANACEHGNM